MLSKLKAHASHIDELLDEMCEIHGINFQSIEECEKAPMSSVEAYDALDAYWVFTMAKIHRLERKEANA